MLPMLTEGQPAQPMATCELSPEMKTKRIHQKLKSDSIHFARAFSQEGWGSMLGFISIVQSISHHNEDILDPSRKKLKPVKSPEEELLHQKKAAVKAQCTKLGAALLKDIPAKSAAELTVQYKELKAMQKEWLALRTALKPEGNPVRKIPSYSMVLVLVHARLRIQSGHERNLQTLGDRAFHAAIFKGLPFVYHRSPQNEIFRYLAWPQDNATGHKMEEFVQLAARRKTKIASAFERHATCKPFPFTFTDHGTCHRYQFMRLYTPEQIYQLIERGDLEELNTYMVNYPFAMPCALIDLIFGDRKKLSQEQVNFLFLKFSGYPRLLKIISPYVTFENPDFAAKFLRLSLDRSFTQCVSRVLKEKPNVVLIDPKPKDLLDIIEAGFEEYAKRLIEQGLSANSETTSFNFKDYHQVQTSIGCYVKRIEREIHAKRTEELAALAPAPFLDFLSFLISRGANVNQRMASNGTSEYDCTILERCYFNRSKYDAIFTKIVDILLEGGADISPRLAQAMLMEFKATGNPHYMGALLKQRYITEEQLQRLLICKDSPPTEKDALIQKALDAVVWLDKMANLSRKNAAGLDYAILSDIRSLKKNFKAYLSECKKKGQPEEQAVLHACQALHHAYDKVIAQDLLLSELRHISQEIRAFANNPDPYKRPSHRLIRFYGLWSPENSTIYKDAEQRVNVLFKETRSHYWGWMRNRVLEKAQSVEKDRYLSRHPITWLHGSLSTSLPIILKMQNLAPLGLLLANHIPTFSGEICGTDLTINAKNLSGERLTMRWDEGIQQWYDAISRAHTCYVYASQARGYRPTERTFKPELSWQRASIANVQTLLNSQHDWGAGRHGLWTVVRLDILRLRSTDKKADEKLSGLKEFIANQLASKKLSKEDQTEMQSLMKALKAKLKVFFDEADLQAINHPDSYGVIFASTTLYSKGEFGDKDPMEHVVEGPIPLGHEIQAAFTSPEKVEELGKLLRPYGIRVYDFHTAFYLEMLQMIRGTRLQTLQKSLAGLDPLAAEQRMIALSLQQDILPQYAKPFPESPKYTLVDEKGSQKRVDIPNPAYPANAKTYAEYLSMIGHGIMPAREYHGMTHAARTALWSQLVQELYKREDTAGNADRSGLLVALTAGAHDLARQDDGEDRWDRSSARWLRAYLISQGLSEEQIEPYYLAIKDKDPAGKLFKSVPQRSVHDADVLEIVRTLADISAFRKEELCFYKELKCPGIDKDALIAEIHDFIQKTEDKAFKMYLEMQSQDVYGDLMLALINAHQKEGRYPTIVKLLGARLHAFQN